MNKTKSPMYITKEEAVLAMRTGKGKEEQEWAIRAIPARKIRKCGTPAKTFFRGDDERCPHCKKSVDLYYLSKDVPKFCYCLWCGGAIYREKALGKRNPMFDYKALTESQIKEWGVERYVNEQVD